MKNLFLLSALVVGLGFNTITIDCLHAAIFTVTTTNISGPGSLPVAIAQANSTPGENQIQISVADVITLGLQLPTITNSVAITGVANTPTVISGGGTLPLFTFAAGTTNSLSNLVLANGYTTDGGAAIINASTLSVSGCVITNNFAPIGYGGAVSNTGALTIGNTTFQNNRATNGGALFSSGNMIIFHCHLSQNQAGNGGAIFNTGNLGLNLLNISNNVALNSTFFNGPRGGGIYNASNLTIVASVFVNNSAIGRTNGGGIGYGGALSSSLGTVGITNSTFYQNSANSGSGGTGGGQGLGGAVIVTGGNCSFVNCTISANAAVGWVGGNASWGYGGGIYGGSGTVSIVNTVVAGNTVAGNFTYGPDLYGTFVSSGSNLIGNNQNATGLSIFDFQNVVANLGPLQDNGGSTPTCAPLQGSYAIGYGTGIGAPTTDQRGVPRPQGGAFDIGSVEVVTNSPFIAGAAMVSGSGFSLTAIFDATNSYRIQASTNLTIWISLITNGSGGTLYFTDSAAANMNRRFYRTAKP